MPIAVTIISPDEARRLLSRQEGHFVDFKSKDIRPAKLTKAISAFSNADGGELYVGVSEDALKTHHWDGFILEEDANGHIQALEALFPLGNH